MGGVLIAGLAVLLAGMVLMPRFLGLATGPEVEIITTLKDTEQDALVLPVPGALEPLKSTTHHFARITVTMEPGGERAVAWATLDLIGQMGRTRVSTLGVERIPFVRRGREWVPEGSWAPRLVAVVRALEARRRALESGEPRALEALRAPGTGSDAGEDERISRVMELQRRRYQAQAWYVRLERDEAMASEEWRLEGVLPSRPVEERGERGLSLIRHAEEFFFSSSLM